MIGDSEFLSLFQMALKDFYYFSIAKSYFSFLKDLFNSNKLSAKQLNNKLKLLVSQFSHDFVDGSFFFREHVKFLQ